MSDWNDGANEETRPVPLSPWGQDANAAPAYPTVPIDAPPPGYTPTLQYHVAEPPPYEPPLRPTHRRRNALIAVGAVLVVAAATTFVLVDVAGGTQHTAGSSPARTGTSSASHAPSGQSPSPRVSLTSISTAHAFDTNLLNTAATDPIPFTAGALLPQEFMDGKGVAYMLVSSGAESCTNAVMSSDVRAALKQYGCTREMVGAYTVNSSTVDSSDDILVSVQVFAFKDAATAKRFAAKFPPAGSWDFGIWCPTTGYGANPCTAKADYPDAARSESVGQDYRYVIEATALYTEMTTSHAEDAWTEAAANKALKTAGPAAYIADHE